MSPSKALLPSYASIIAELLRSATGPVPVAGLAEQMLAARPSQSKNVRQAMRQHLRGAEGLHLVFLDSDTVLPLRLAFQGARFRLPLDPDSVTNGLLRIGETLPSYLPQGFPLDKVRFVDAAGQPIPFRIQKRSETLETLFGRTTAEILCADLNAWFRAENVNAQDHLLFTLVDWEQGVIQLEREPFSQDLLAQRAARNRLLADLFYGLLESAVTEAVYVREAVPTVYARLPDKGSYPPDHWLIVVAADKRLNTDGWRILYSDSGLSTLELVAADWLGELPQVSSRPVSKEAGAQVYRFKAALTHRPDLWRTIEIQGRHSLANLDGVLRSSFNHDVSDHLGGFWKLVPRGGPAKPGGKPRGAARQPRYREVELGDVDPEGGGTGTEVKIAELDLAVGDQLKYVYDFGDWIEHRLTLEAIAAPQSRVKYPREVGRNEPQYSHCVECQQQGRQTVAKWICLDCSDGPEAEILLCPECAEERHEDHYLEEILY